VVEEEDEVPIYSQRGRKKKKEKLKGGTFITGQETTEKKGKEESFLDHLPVGHPIAQPEGKRVFHPCHKEKGKNEEGVFPE